MAFDPHNYFGFLTNRIARLINKLAKEDLEENGFNIPPSCIGILAELWAKDGLSQKELGVSVIKEKSSINKMLVSLEKDNLIIKKIDEQDKRTNRIYLTARGKQLKKLIAKKKTEVQSGLLESVSPAEIETTKKVLNTLYHQLLEKNQ